MCAQIKINNKKPLITGIIAAALFSLVLCELLQGFAAVAAGAGEIHFRFAGIKLYAVYELDKGVFAAAAISLIPYLLTMAAITAGVILLKKTEAGLYRHFLIVFSLVLSGFLLFNLFHGAFSIILKFNKTNDWVELVSVFKLSEPGGIIFIFLVIIFSVGYLNLLLKRILNYINR